MMKKKIFFTAVGILSVLLFISLVYRIGNKPVTNSSVIDGLTLFQRAMKENDIEKIWALSGRVHHALFKNEYSRFKEEYERWSKKHPSQIQSHSKARLEDVKMITLNRAWVKCKSLNGLKGFYMVKEENKWKYGNITSHLGKIGVDMGILADAIGEYYTDKNYLPLNLSELIPEYINEIPLDPFSDETKFYSYEILDERSYKVYSIGIDSADDFGIVEYDISVSPDQYQYLDFGKGDIIRIINF